jgi:hypothetical protein
MKISLAFVATISAQVITFKSNEDGIGPCDLEYVKNGDEGELTTTGCSIQSAEDTTATIIAHRNQLSLITERIANTVCASHVEPSQLRNNLDGHYTHFDWSQEHYDPPTNDHQNGVDHSYGDSFCKYDCKTGFHGGSNDGTCAPCLTSCSVGYRAKSVWENHAKIDNPTGDNHQCIIECEHEPNFCPSYFDMSGANTDTPTERHFGHTETINCMPGYEKVGNPSVTCNSDGQWMVDGFCARYNKVGHLTWNTVNVHSGIRSCAGETRARCPSGYVAVGGGMANYYRDIAPSARRIHANVFDESRPSADNKGWVCNMGAIEDCGRINCFATCVPENTMEVKIRIKEYDINQHTSQTIAGTTSATDGSVPISCDEGATHDEGDAMEAGWSITGVGMANHLAHDNIHLDENDLFEEYAFDGANGAKCNMGASSTTSNPRFSCYAVCAKAKQGKTFSCETVSSQPGMKHNVQCKRPHDRATSAGIKQLNPWTNLDTQKYLHIFENAQPKSIKSVFCDSGYGENYDSVGGSDTNLGGLNVCQARCCHVHDM